MYVNTPVQGRKGNGIFTPGLTSPRSRVAIMFEHRWFLGHSMFGWKRKPWPSRTTSKAFEAEHFFVGQTWFHLGFP